MSKANEQWEERERQGAIVFEKGHCRERETIGTKQRQTKAIAIHVALMRIPLFLIGQNSTKGPFTSSRAIYKKVLYHP